MITGSGSEGDMRTKVLFIFCLFFKAIIECLCYRGKWTRRRKEKELMASYPWGLGELEQALRHQWDWPWTGPLVTVGVWLGLVV